MLAAVKENPKVKRHSENRHESKNDDSRIRLGKEEREEREYKEGHRGLVQHERGVETG